MKKKSPRISFYLFLLIIFSQDIFSQNVGINTSGAIPNSAAIVDVNSSPHNNQGMLIPRMTDTQRKALKSPATGLLIYNTTSNALDFYSGSGWQQINGSSVSTASGVQTAPGNGIAINTTGSAPAASALLDISSTGKGLLIPRTTQGAVTAVTGLTIYNSTTNAINVYNGSSWTVPCYSLIDNVTGSGATANGVAINTSGAPPDASAILDISSVSKGLLLPSLTSTQRDTLPSPAQGLLIYNTTDGAIEYWTGTAWMGLLAAPTSASASAAPNPICIGSSLNITGSASGATGWSWAGPNSFSAGTQNGTITNFSFPNQGTYTLTASNGCGSATPVTTASITARVMYVPVTLTNNQSSATPANFQQMIAVNSSLYTNAENTGLQNVEFSTGPGATGTILEAWIESGATNTSASTIYWVNLGANTIAASGGILTIYMNFMPSNVLSSLGPTGEAPQIPGVYGQYDNGTQVFTIYTNWAGTSLPAGWAVSESGATYSINNGLTLNPSGGGSVFLYYNTAQTPVGYMLDAYFSTATAASDGHDELIGWAQSPSSSTTFEGGSSPGWWGWVNGIWTGLHQYQEVGATSGGSGTQPWSGPPVTTYPIIVTSSWQSNAANIGYFNYINAQTNSGTIPSITYANKYVPIGGFLSSGGTVTYYWWRERLYPPNATMPTVNFGSLTCY